MTVGQKIHDLRKKKGISQEELGFELDVSRQTISRWEADMMQPTTDNIRALCDYFQVDPNFFLTDEPKEPAKSIVAASVVEKRVDAKELTTETTAAQCETSEPAAAMTTETQSAMMPVRSKKLIVLYTILITVSTIIFALCVTIGSIAIFVAKQPSLGYSKVEINHMDPTVLACLVVAGCALIVTLILIIFLIRHKKREMECFRNKM